MISNSFSIVSNKIGIKQAIKQASVYVYPGYVYVYLGQIK